jgi:hypothetical protein
MTMGLGLAIIKLVSSAYNISLTVLPVTFGKLFI